MTIEVTPETERLIREEIENGHFQSVDELVANGVRAWREKHPAEKDSPMPQRSLHDILMDPRFRGSELVIERQKDYPRPIDL